MYHWIEDKEFLSQSFRMCADVTNQLKLLLWNEGIDADIFVVGSKRYGLQTQNGNTPIDYDYNALIHNADNFAPDKLKNQIMDYFDIILEKNKWGHCHVRDSTSVITTRTRRLPKGNQTPFSIDLCILKEDRAGNRYRLIHDKTGIVADDRYIWNKCPESRGVEEKASELKPEHWQQVRDEFLDRKNYYLKKQDHTHPSYVCYIEAVNNVYNEVFGQNGQVIIRPISAANIAWENVYRFQSANRNSPVAICNTLSNRFNLK